MRKLIACLACRNEGTRLFGKPLQNLDIKNSISILDYMVMAIKTYPSISSIVLAISDGSANQIYKEVAIKHQISYVFGPEEDVLARLIKACNSANGTDIFRLTTESPFTYFELISDAWKLHVDHNNDLTALDNLPDGSGFEIIKLDAYNKSWKNGASVHRSELCSLYIRENKRDFKIAYIEAPRNICRTDIRLTVDYPEDLILCRAIYAEFLDLTPRIPLEKIINFLDANPHYKKLVDKYIEDGLKTMYL